MAAALSLTFGRGGALLGNLLFGMLIDEVCVVPIVLFGSLLVGKLIFIYYMHHFLYNVIHEGKYYIRFCNHALHGHYLELVQKLINS